MFFIFEINPVQKCLEFQQTVICSQCGKYGRYNVYVTYMCFSMFFIPIIKWNKRYFVKTSCCNTCYEIDKSLGDAVARGKVSELKPEDLHFAGQENTIKRCSNCGYMTDENFDFCPKCGKPF